MWKLPVVGAVASSISQAFRQEGAECFIRLVCLSSASQAACLAHKNAGKTPSSAPPPPDTITPVWGFSLREFSYFTEMSECYTVGLVYCERRSILAGFHPGSLGCCPEKGCEKLHVCGVYCLPPFNGTLSRPVLTAWASSGSSVCVCVPLYVAVVPNIFIDIFVCCCHLGPPRVYINLCRQPRPLISWPSSGPSAFLPFTPSDQQRPSPHPLSQCCCDVVRILLHPL